MPRVHKLLITNFTAKFSGASMLKYYFQFFFDIPNFYDVTACRLSLIHQKWTFSELLERDFFTVQLQLQASLLRTEWCSEKCFGAEKFANFTNNFSFSTSF